MPAMPASQAPVEAARAVDAQRRRWWWCLGLVLLLGTLARAPGLIWGYGFFGTEAVVLHPDERPYTWGHGPATGFPSGLSNHVRALTALLHGLGLRSLLRWIDWGYFAGRLVSLVYGVLTLLVLARLARSLFGDPRIGLLAAFFLALADLHVTYSHIGIPDAPATFWYYAALASASTALGRGSTRAFLLSGVCTGAAAAMRFQLTSLLPLAWCVARSRRRLLHALALAASVSASFAVFSGLRASPTATWHLMAGVAAWGGLGWKKLFLPLVYLAVLLVGVGLPVFLLAGYGLVRLARAKWETVRGWRGVLADDQLAVCAAPLAAFVQLGTVGLWAHRHAVVLVPFVALLAAYGAIRLPRPALGRLAPPVLARGLVGLVGVYLAVQVASVQAYFVDDPLEKAGRWLRAHVPPGEVLSKDPAAKVPPEYPTTAEWKANYLILSARSYRRYLVKDFLPTRLTGRALSPQDIEAGAVFGGDPEFAVRLQALLRGELPYRLVEKIRLRFYTPELLLTQALWYPPPHLNEVLIYERLREREKRLVLLTPSRTDYLVTLDTGTPWRPEPGQAVELRLNGHPLTAALRGGETHLFVPRALVTAPRSELRLASARPLPHLPLGALARVRRVGTEFTVDALLDGDLMVDGFYGPEVRADGATWRWTGSVGRVLLPGPGAGGAWKRLAVRLRGRPPDGRPPQPVAFVLDGRKVGEATVSDVDRTVELPVPEGTLVGETGSLEVVTTPWRPAELGGSSDSRQLGVAVYWVRLSRTDRFQPLEYEVETVGFPSGRLTLRADLFAPKGADRGTILLAHGANALGRRHGLSLGLARRLADRGYRVLSPDFRGYGESDAPPRVAAPGDPGFTGDLVAAVSFLQTRLRPREVTVVGHASGAAVALAVAARDPRVGKVVVIAPGRQVREPVPGAPAIETYLDHPFRQPVLLIDGEREEEAERRALADVARRMKARPAYVTIPNADRFFGIERQSEDRDPVTLSALADVIDGWLREGASWPGAGPEDRGAR